MNQLCSSKSNDMWDNGFEWPDAKDWDHTNLVRMVLLKSVTNSWWKSQYKAK